MWPPFGWFGSDLANECRADGPGARSSAGHVAGLRRQLRRLGQQFGDGRRLAEQVPGPRQLLQTTQFGGCKNFGAENGSRVGMPCVRRSCLNISASCLDIGMPPLAASAQSEVQIAEGLIRRFSGITARARHDGAGSTLPHQTLDRISRSTDAQFARPPLASTRTSRRRERGRPPRRSRRVHVLRPRAMWNVT